MRAIRHSRQVTACLATLLVAALVGACVGGSSATEAPSATGSAEPSPVVPIETVSPASGSPAPLPSDPAESEAPSDSPGAESSGSPPPSDEPGSADACSGTDNNRDFYADAAHALAFDVYCPVLPRGWFVDEGEYQLRGGGLLQISYKGPAGAVLDLLERGPCQAGDDCLPAGTQEGTAMFGNRSAELVAKEDGSLMVVAEAPDGQWWISGTRVDEASLTEIAADLVLVGG
jgi:hypothetical protein